MGQNKTLDTGFCGGSDPGLIPEIYVVLVFYETFK